MEAYEYAANVTDKRDRVKFLGRLSKAMNKLLH